MALQFSAGQMTQLDAIAEREFIGRLVDVVFADAPAGEGAPGIAKRCELLVARARASGFVTELEIATFVMCANAYGDDFDTRPDLPFADVLSSVETDRAEQAERLLAALDAMEADHT